MNFLLNEIEESKFDAQKLELLRPEMNRLKGGSSIRLFFAQAYRIAGCLKEVSSFLDERMPFFSRRQDAEIEMQRYFKLLEEARNSVV